MGKLILETFRANDFSLIAVVLLMPLVGAFVNGVFGRRLGKQAVRIMALVAIGVSFAAAILTLLGLNQVIDASSTKEMIDGHEVAHAAHAKVSWLAWEWMRANGPHGAPTPIELKFSVDALSGVMMLVVTGVGFLIHVYSTEYMIEDKGYWRFFAYLNLFIFSMLVLILGDNLPVLFIGWEGVGLCSYLLIGFWYGKSPNASAGKKAFIMNRIGDFGLLVGMFLLLQFTGALDWDGMAKNAMNLISTSRETQVHLWPIGGGQFADTSFLGITIPLSKLQPHDARGGITSYTMTAATAVGLMLFLGCTGKSAQIPLYTWLPDAMAGPTPVSALIHAATMVTAGIYLICRMSFVFVLSPATMTVIAFTGATTAVLAATIALVQNDIKRVLAYSTVSQLGYMVLGVGVGAFTAGFFHVFTHAFFKACLFLGAGSVIHSMHARVHDDDRSQDMRNMGGLKKYMPTTFWTFAVSTAAIIGLPLTSGWFSKDEILASTLVHGPAGISITKTPPWTPPSWVPWVLWGMGTLAAAMTAFYMCRAVFLTFFGEFKGWTIGRPSKIAKAAQNEHGAPENEATHEDDDHHHEDDLSQPGLPPQESPPAMTIPLVILAAFAAVAGILNPAALKMFVHGVPVAMDHWLEPVFAEASKGVATLAHEEALGRERISAAGAFFAFGIGTYAAYWMYVVQKGKPAKELALAWPRLYRWAYAKWKVDEAYDKTVVAGVDALADTAASVDQGIVDFILARLTSLVVAALGTVLRVVQNGVVHVYAAVMVVGLAVLGWFFITPHADASVIESPNGDYTFTAGPGPGYAYCWTTEAGKCATKDASPEEFKAPDTFKTHLDENKDTVVRLVVRNAFGRFSTKEFPIKRPPAEKAPPTAQFQLPGGG